MKIPEKEIRILIFKDRELYIAQCLEYDIAVQAYTLNELEEKFICTIQAYISLSIENREPPFSHIPETPKRFWEMFKKANPLLKPLKISVPSRKKIEGRSIREWVPRQAFMALSESPHAV